MTEMMPSLGGSKESPQRLWGPALGGPCSTSLLHVWDGFRVRGRVVSFLFFHGFLVKRGKISAESVK